MGIATLNAVINHSNDAGFRAWAGDLRTLLLTGGALVQTADLWQLDLATATRPATNTDGAPMLFALTDSLQTAAPYILAVYCGTGTTADRPRIRVALGTGTTGAGALTGIQLAPTEVTRTVTPAVATLRDSRACGLPGYIGVCYQQAAGGGSTPALAFIGMHRVLNAACEQTAEGVSLYYIDTSGNLLSRAFRRTPSAAEFGPSAAVTFVPLGTTASVIDGGARLLYPHETALPDVRPVTAFVTVVSAEFGAGLTFAARPVGVTDITYMCLGVTGVSTPGVGLPSATSHSLCLRWE